jgi:DNA-binding helix-hairpin-helix protein with protein kinase domain
MTEPYSPVAVETAIRECVTRITKGVFVCRDLYTAYQEAEQDFIEAFAHARISATGPQQEKRYKAELATMDERKRRDVAEAAYKHANRLAEALENELRAWQSVNKSVTGAYNAAGVGER